MKTFAIITLSIFLILLLNNYPDPITARIENRTCYLNPGNPSDEIDTYAFSMGGGDIPRYFRINREEMWKFVWDSYQNKWNWGTRRTKCQRCGYLY